MSERLRIISEALEGKSLKVNAFGKVYDTVFTVDLYHLGYTVAVELVMADDPENPFCTLTCNIPNITLGDREILVKTWSENEEPARCALASGFFKDTGKRVSTGFVQAQIWEVL